MSSASVRAATGLPYSQCARRARCPRRCFPNSSRDTNQSHPQERLPRGSLLGLVAIAPTLPQRAAREQTAIARFAKGGREPDERGSPTGARSARANRSGWGARGVRGAGRLRGAEEQSRTRGNFFIDAYARFRYTVKADVPEWRNGRRGGLKNRCLTTCEFDSRLGHQFSRKQTAD